MVMRSDKSLFVFIITGLALGIASCDDQGANGTAGPGPYSNVPTTPFTLMGCPPPTPDKPASGPCELWMCTSENIPVTLQRKIHCNAPPAPGMQPPPSYMC